MGMDSSAGIALIWTTIRWQGFTPSFGDPEKARIEFLFPFFFFFIFFLFFFFLFFGFMTVYRIHK